jgi:hypothetical protein
VSHKAAVSARVSHLESLGGELRKRGLAVRLAVPRGGPPSLHVVNPRASVLTENILAQSTDGVWWFWWSWAEPIAPVADLDEVADRVVRMLTGGA